MTGRPSPVLSHHAALSGDTLAAAASLREWYAGLALQGLLACPAVCGDGPAQRTIRRFIRGQEAAA